jgi:hypothetical protein
MTNNRQAEALSSLAQIRELLQSAHWAARELDQRVPVDIGRLLDEIHAARKAAESVHTALCGAGTAASGPP